MFNATIKALPVTRSLIASSCVLLAVACSTGGSDSSTGVAATPAPSASEMGEPVQTVEPAAAPAPTAGSNEGSPVGAELAQPAEESNAPGAPPESDVPVAGTADTPIPTPGCGSTAGAASGRFSIDVGGAEREYILALPDDYDAERPYRLVFTWHPGGGSAQGTANTFYGLRQNADGSAIFVSPEGIDEGWANTDGRDIAFLDAMLDRFRAELCYDETRVFSTGFSYGGMMSFAIGCGRADIFRAIAPMSGALFSGCADGEAGIAMLAFHGVSDTVVDISAGVRARDVIVERNGCEADAPAVDDSGCSSFQGCSEGRPVTWCEFDGGHTPAPQSGARIWDFFAQF